MDNEPDKPIPFLRVTNLTDTGELNFSDRVFVSKSTHNGFLSRSVVRPDDVLMNIVGPPLGQVSTVPSDYDEWNINQAIAIFRAIPGILPKFIAHHLLSASAQAWFKVRAKTTAGQTNLTLELCRELPVPLPPPEEQTEIVNTLETALTAVKEQQTAIERGLKQSTAQRQNILRAAFSGQLVPQDPNDEPASRLLERIRAERAARGAAKKPRSRKAKEVT
jgi:type I restriction enzyme S subunit